MPNRLEGSSSPYLLQHARNPVDWWPWGDEAFEEARGRDVPVFLSVGYSTCHWCHVMERESFEDVGVAEVLNRAFVCIKVDREERPDVDSQYMAVCQAIGRQCGWPLTVLLTPERLPFYVATYLPKHSRFGRPGLLELSARVSELWTQGREKVHTSALQVTELVRRSEHLPPPESIRPDALEEAVAQLEARFDPVHGGFGSAPKFPMAHNLVFLLRYGVARKHDRAVGMALDTLRSMACSALHDQLGGGFHRYSTDAEWRLPHFEKMLYDQAWMLVAFTEGWEASRDPLLKETALSIAGYLTRDLQDPEGGFHAGEDADSEGEEGLFYLWTVEEIDAALDGADAAFARAWFGLEAGGNYRDEATREVTGRNVLHPGRSGMHRAGRAMRGKEDPGTVAQRVRENLFRRRALRPRPSRDEKILADWNGLVIGALARAGARLGEPALVAEARRAARFAMDRLGGAAGQLRHLHFRGHSSTPAFLDDYACLAWGCLELALASHEPEWIEASARLCERMISGFRAGTGGFWHTEGENDAMLVRQQQFNDGAMPSGNAVALDTLVRLSRLTGRADLEDAATQLASAAGRYVNAAPGAYAGLLLGVMQTVDSVGEVILVGTPGSAEFDALASVVADAYLPEVVVWRTDPGRSAAPAREYLEPLDKPLPAGWRAAAYVCRNRTCGPPARSAGELHGMLAAWRS